MSQTTDTIAEAVARAWASMDGRPFDDPEYGQGYMADAEALLDRSGLSARLATAEAERDALKAAKWDVQHTDTMNDLVQMGMARDAALQEGVKLLEAAIWEHVGRYLAGQTHASVSGPARGGINHAIKRAIAAADPARVAQIAKGEGE